MSKTSAELASWLASNDQIKVILIHIYNVPEASGTLYLSNKPYVTEGGETPPSTAYLPYLHDDIVFEETFSSTGELSVDFGNVSLINKDGSLDDWLHWTWTNKNISIEIGDPRWSRQDFVKVFDGVINSINASGRYSLQLSLFNKIERINTAITDKTLKTLYPNDDTKPVGANQNRENVLPLCFGECFNVSPLRISSALGTGNTNEEIYMVHDGPIQGIIEIRDNGVPLVEGTGYTVNLSNGTFELLRKPEGMVTCSVQGSTLGGIYSNKISDIVKYIVTNYGPVDRRFSLAELDTAEFSTFSSQNHQPVGVYITDRDNILDVCQQLAGSIGANVVMNKDKLTIKRFTLPGYTNPDQYIPKEITENDIVLNSLEVEETHEVKGAIKLEFCKNWTVQESGMAGGVPPTALDIFKKEYAGEAIVDQSVIDSRKLSKEPPEPEQTLLLVKSDAVNEAQRRLDLWKNQRFTYTMEGFPWLSTLEVGMKVRLSNYRFGLNNGKDGTITSLSKNISTGKVTIGVFI